MKAEFVSPLLIVLLIVLVLLTVFGIFYLFITAKSKERMALIEKGMDPNLAKSDFWIQIGLIGAGFCLGLVVSDLIASKWGPLLGFIFAGTALVIYNIFRKNKARRNSI